MQRMKQLSKRANYTGNRAYHISENEGTELKSTQKLIPLQPQTPNEAPDSGYSREGSNFNNSRYHIEDAPHDKELVNQSDYIGNI